MSRGTGILPVICSDLTTAAPSPDAAVAFAPVPGNRGIFPKTCTGIFSPSVSFHGQPLPAVPIPLTVKKTDESAPPSLGDFLIESQRRDPAAGDFSLEAPDLLAVRVNGRVRARATAVLAASGQVRVTPASRFATLAGKDESAGLLAAVDGKGRVLLGESGKTIALFDFKRAEALAVAPHAILALEDTVSFSPIPVKLPLKKPVEWTGLSLKGPGKVALVVTGTLHTLRVTPEAPLFVRTGAVVGWSANLAVVGRAGSAGDARLAFAGDGFVLMQTGLER